MTAAALVRHALVAMLDNEVADALADAHSDPMFSGKTVKLTLRLTAGHAYLLSSRARKADVSQGAYVASLIDGAPLPPKAPDHARAVDVLRTSSDRLAVITADLNAFMRMLARVPSSELEPYRASIHSLRDDVRKHLAASAELVAELRPARGRK